MAKTTEGYISEIVFDSSSTEVRFTLDPTPPYLIENKDEREIILRDGAMATVVPLSHEFLFQAPKKKDVRVQFDANSLLIMKACRVKVELSIDSCNLTKGLARVGEIRVL